MKSFLQLPYKTNGLAGGSRKPLLQIQTESQERKRCALPSRWIAVLFILGAHLRLQVGKSQATQLGIFPEEPISTEKVINKEVFRFFNRASVGLGHQVTQRVGPDEQRDQPPLLFARL